MSWGEDSFTTPTTEPYEEELWSRQGSANTVDLERMRQDVKDKQAVLNVLFEGEYNPTYGPNLGYLFDNTKVVFVDGVIDGVTFIGKRVTKVQEGKLVFEGPSAYLTRFKEGAMKAEDEFEATPQSFS